MWLKMQWCHLHPLDAITLLRGIAIRFTSLLLPLQEVGTRDSYFSRFDPQEEHDAYRQAEQRLEERHRERVSKVSRGTNTLLRHLWYPLYHYM